jgi:hypothetical protein
MKDLSQRSSRLENQLKREETTENLPDPVSLTTENLPDRMTPFH